MARLCLLSPRSESRCPRGTSASPRKKGAFPRRKAKNKTFPPTPREQASRLHRSRPTGNARRRSAIQRKRREIPNEIKDNKLPLGNSLKGCPHPLWRAFAYFRRAHTRINACKSNCPRGMSASLRQNSINPRRRRKQLQSEKTRIAPAAAGISETQPLH